MRPGVWLWLLVIVAATTLPWRFVGHAHWSAIDWVPFIGSSGGPRALLRDAPLNFLLFVPLGVLLAGDSRRGLTTVVAAALSVSIAVEFFQVFCHGRFPSINDVIANVSGAAAGGWAVHHRIRRWLPGTSRG